MPTNSFLASTSPTTPLLATQKNATNLGGGFPIGPTAGIGMINQNYQTFGGGGSGAPGIIRGGGGGGGAAPSGGNANDAAVATQSADYDRIMQGYKDILSGPGITPQTRDYSASNDVTGSLRDLSNLTSTGGYTPEGIQDIRERSISPIRSIYANAQRELQRKNALSGGNTANYGALTSKMARESADIIGGITTNANAQIAQNVAQNKISIAPSYSAAAQRENDSRTQVEQHNADIMNQINEFNMGIKQNALGGMTSLYGTTPALIDTFGRQALGSRGLDIQQGAQRNSQQLELLKSILSSAGSF